MNLKQKLIEIRKEVKQLQRTKQAYGYKYVPEDKILGVVRDKMDELGVLLEMKVISAERLEVFTYLNSKNKEVKENVIQGKLEFVWADAESDEERTVPFAMFGQQQDTSQAFGSGLTYSNRYFLLKYFQIATNENDPDKIRSEITKKDKIESAMTVKTAREFENLELKDANIAKMCAKYNCKKWTDMSNVDALDVINDTYKARINGALDKEENAKFRLEVLNVLTAQIESTTWKDTVINSKSEYDKIVKIVLEELTKLKVAQ